MKKKILKHIIKKDEIILWNSQKSNRVLSSIMLASIVFLNILFILIGLYESIGLKVLILVLLLILLLIVIIIFSRDYFRIRHDDIIHFISNTRIGKIKIFREDSVNNSFILDEISVEDLTSIQIFYELEFKGKITIKFFSKHDEIFQFEDMKEVLYSLKKILIKNFNIQIIEKGSNNEEIVLKN